MSFGLPPFGGIAVSFQTLDDQPVACGLRPTGKIWSDGKSRVAGKLGPAAPVPAKPRFLRGEYGIWNPNPIFEMASRNFPKCPI